MNLVFKKDDMQSMLRKGLTLTAKGLKEQGKILPARMANQKVVAAEKAIRVGKKGKLVAKRGILPKLKNLSRRGKQKAQLAKYSVKNTLGDIANKRAAGKTASKVVRSSNNTYIKQFENLTKNFKGKDLEEGIKMLLVKMPMDEKYRKTIKHIATNVYGIKL